MTEAKNVLVTGGSGFIGSALIRRLSRSTKYSICNLDKLTYASNPIALTDVQHKSTYKFYQIDILNLQGVQKIIFEFQPDIIYHLAAETHVDRSIESSDLFLQTNVLGTHNMLKAGLAYWESLSKRKAEQFRFHHVSTDEVYGDLGKYGRFFTEKSPYYPSSPYSASKASSDHLVRAWHRTYGLPVLITNCSNNYGPFQNSEKLIPKVITNAICGETIPVYGNGKQKRDWLYVDDHADALMVIAEKASMGSTYNISGNNTLTNLQVIQNICKLLERLMPKNYRGHSQFDKLIRFVEDRPGHDIKYSLDAKKLERDLHWKPKETFETGLEKTVKWFVDQMFYT